MKNYLDPDSPLDYATHLSQCAETVDRLLDLGIEVLDRRFKEQGFALRHPELLMSFVRAAVTDYQTTVIFKECLPRLLACLNHREPVDDA